MDKKVRMLKKRGQDGGHHLLMQMIITPLMRLILVNPAIPLPAQIAVEGLGGLQGGFRL